MKRSSIPIDTVDLLSAPMFAATMVAEAQVLKRRPGGRPEISTTGPRPSSPTRAIRPTSWWRSATRRRDTAASLAALAGNVAVSIITAGMRSAGSTASCSAIASPTSESARGRS
ncbi:MAG: hypothetical protein R2695_18630 [Acidimicrobiales bacterium]